jgi:WD40 repeat protein
VVIWEARARRQERILPTPFNTAVLFSPDGRWLATATHGHYTIWEAGQWTARHQFTNDAGPGSSLMSFSPDARLLAVRKSAEEVQLLDPATGLEVACLPGATLTPRCFNPDGTRLVVLEGDRRLRVWDLRRLRQELAKMNLDWELPPYPPAPDLPPPVRIEILTK